MSVELIIMGRTVVSACGANGDRLTCKRLARALIELEYQAAKAEAAAEAEHQQKASQAPKKARRKAGPEDARVRSVRTGVVPAALAARGDARADCAGLSPAGHGRRSADHY